MSNTDTQIRSPYFIRQYSKNRLIRDLLEGRDAFVNTNHESDADSLSTSARHGESYYLPKEPDEPDHIYERRLSRSFLTNYFEHAINTDSGKILSSPIILSVDDNESLPDQVQEWVEDINLQGAPLEEFTSNQLKAALSKGVVLSYVDYINDLGRPFAKQIDIDDVLSFKTDGRTGKLTYLRWASSIINDSDDDDILIDNKNVIFEITPTSWAVYDEGEDQPTDAGEIERFRNGKERITDEIPVSVFYTNKKNILLADTPYRNLAELNLEHFQLQSGIKNIEYFSLVPILFGKGFDSDTPIKSMASYQLISAGEDAINASLDWVQVDAAPMEQAKKSLKDIEDRISLFGVDLSSIRPSGTRTATQQIINASGKNAALVTFGKGLAEHIERVLDIMGSYTVAPIKSSVDITPDFSVANNNDNVKNAIEAEKARAISKKTLTDVMKNNNNLPAGYDYYEDQALISEVSVLNDV